MAKKKNGLEHGYTPEEYANIRENFKKAFGTPYGMIDLDIKHLLGTSGKHMDIIKENRIYWTQIFGQMAKELGLDNVKWTRIKVTYVRSNVAFFKFIDANKGSRIERNFDVDSHFGESLVPEEIHFDEIPMLSKNRVIFQFKTSPHLAGKHIKVWDDNNNRVDDIIIDENGYEVKEDA